MNFRHAGQYLSAAVVFAFIAASASAEDKEPLFPNSIDVRPKLIKADPSVRYDYDIVYVRSPRNGDDRSVRWGEIAHPALMESGADLMLLHPDCSEELLVAGGEDGAIADPVVSFDGQWVYYSHVKGLKGTDPFGLPPLQGADIYKLHVKTRQVVRLTDQTFTPNTGAADWSKDFRTQQEGKTWLAYGVLNLGPCPLPGGRLAFVSNRNAFRSPKHPSPTLQLFVMDGDGSNVECIGHLNLGMALHPTCLTDGRILFSSMESQGLRNSILWGLWSINPDGTHWQPVISAFDPGDAPNAFHFQTQLSDGSIIAEEYYNQNNDGFGAYVKLPPPSPPAPLRRGERGEMTGDYPGFGPADRVDPRNPPLRFGRFYNGKGKYYRLGFSPAGIESLTRFADNGEGPADPSALNKQDSPAVGKFTQPSGAPDDNLLTVWTPGPANHQNGLKPPAVDAGLYLIKGGKPIDEPGQMLLIKNDPKYNELWPHALVPYKRIYGIDEPKRLTPLANDGSLSKLLPEGTPFGLVGASSLLKRESYPDGAVPKGAVTAGFAGGRDRTNGFLGLDPFNTSQNGASLNWFNQGAEAGRYTNDDVVAIRILALEPTTDRNRGPNSGRLFRSHAMERTRILGELPVRKFDGDKQPTDPDGNPDTSFLAKIPADTAFTFQTLDKDGMVLNMAQTWHQLRPGEIRTDCGGCHAHSQKPTPFDATAAAGPDYSVFDLTEKTPLLTAKALDESGRKWDAKDETGLRFQKEIKNVEYFRDVKPILDRSCAACHTEKTGRAAGGLVLDDDAFVRFGNEPEVPGTYYRLAEDSAARYGFKPVIANGQWRQTNASRYVRKFQSRRSLLVWKVFGRRCDGWSNDDFPTETTPGDPTTLHQNGEPVPDTPQNRDRADLDFVGSVMPPPDAVDGTYVGLDGNNVKVPPLTAEDRLTLVRWIDLGCPIDLNFDPARPDDRGFGWMTDDQRPTLTVTYPRPGANAGLTRVLVGMCDAYTGLDMTSFHVTADFAMAGASAGADLAPKFRPASPGVWELKLDQPIAAPAKGKLTVSVKDRQGNTTVVERTFSVGGS